MKTPPVAALLAACLLAGSGIFPSAFGASVAFEESEITVSQTAGEVRLRVEVTGIPSPVGTEDVRVRFVDGTATAGWNYGVHGSLEALEFKAYDFPEGESSLEVVVPIQSMRTSATSFTAELEGINGVETGEPATAKVTIEKWTPPRHILREIARLGREIRNVRRSDLPLAQKVRKAKRLARKKARLERAIEPWAELTVMRNQARGKDSRDPGGEGEGALANRPGAALLPPTARRTPSNGLEIVSAVYGSGVQFADVTERIRELIAGNGVFQANPPWLLADPTPYWNKALVVVYRVGGHRHILTSGENGEVSAAMLRAAARVEERRRDAARRTPVEETAELPSNPGELRARELVTVTDDFIVDIHHNGVKIADDSRTLVAEIFGATVERIRLPARSGDWIVFHVVNNRMRWGGAYYFAAAGMMDGDTAGFLSSLDDGHWSYCDDPTDAERFVAERSWGRENGVREITRKWGDGDRLMREQIGEAWTGDPVWGVHRNTWIKVVVP